MQVLGKRYGTAFTARLPFFGPTVIISWRLARGDGQKWRY
jgi:hypothetical protein